MKNYDWNLISIFHQLISIAERNIPESILNLNNQELDEFFRPNKRHILSSYLSAKIETTNATNENLFKNIEIDKLKKAYSIDSYKNQVVSKLLASKSQDQNKLPTKSLYYGSLCSLNDKVIEKQKPNLGCQYCNHSNNLSNNLNQTMNQLNLNNQTSPTTNLAMAKESPFLKTSFHRCKLNHQNKDTNAKIKMNEFKLNEAALTNLPDATAACSPSASAPPIEPSSEWPPSNKQSNEPNQPNSNLESNDQAKMHSWLNLNQPAYCEECKNYQCKVEEAALAFVDNYRNFRAQVESCEKS